MVPLPAAPSCVGIDVGGARKGFHAVALRNGVYAGQLASRDPQALADWCRQSAAAQVIAIDAPSHWSASGGMRACERELLAAGIRCFASPTRQQALEHPRDYYGWMLRGEALYQALAASHPLSTGLPIAGRRCCFETFPHAITWQLQGGRADASRKREQRRALLAAAGLPLAPLPNLDWIDAALCALAAHLAATDAACRSFGEVPSGLIHVPAASSGLAV